MDGLILFGAKYLFLVILALALVVFWRDSKETRFKLFFFGLIVLPIAYIVAKIGSTFYYDPRPFVTENIVPLLPHAPDNGFPSDHTLLSAAVASVVWFFHRRMGTLLLLIAFLVGVARVAAGVHHMIDIVGSTVIAFGVAAIVFRYVFPLVWQKWLVKYVD